VRYVVHGLGNFSLTAVIDTVMIKPHSLRQAHSKPYRQYLRRSWWLPY
jgi:hypothetical protein